MRTGEVRHGVERHGLDRRGIETGGSNPVCLMGGGCPMTDVIDRTWRSGAWSCYAWAGWAMRGMDRQVLDGTGKARVF